MLLETASTVVFGLLFYLKVSERLDPLLENNVHILSPFSSVCVSASLCYESICNLFLFIAILVFLKASF